MKEKRPPSVVREGSSSRNYSPRNVAAAAAAAAAAEADVLPEIAAIQNLAKMARETFWTINIPLVLLPSV